MQRALLPAVGQDRARWVQPGSPIDLREWALRLQPPARQEVSPLAPGGKNRPEPAKRCRAARLNEASFYWFLSPSFSFVTVAFADLESQATTAHQTVPPRYKDRLFSLPTIPVPEPWILFF